MTDEELCLDLRSVPRGAFGNLFDKAAARLEALRAERDAWMETAAQNQQNRDYYVGLIDSVAPMLGAAMYTQDDGGVVPEPLRACLPKAVAELKARAEKCESMLREIDAIEPPVLDACSPDALRGIVLMMGEKARAALTPVESKGGDDGQ